MDSNIALILQLLVAIISVNISIIIVIIPISLIRHLGVGQVGVWQVFSCIMPAPEPKKASCKRLPLRVLDIVLGLRMADM